MNTSPSLNFPHWTLFPLSQLLLATSDTAPGTLWGKAGFHIDAEAVLVVLDNLGRGDDLLVVVKDDWLALTPDLDDLHLAGAGVHHGRSERLEATGVELLPFDLTASLTLGHQLRPRRGRTVLWLDPERVRLSLGMKLVLRRSRRKMGRNMNLIRGWGLWALAWAFTGSRKFFFSYWNTGFFVEAIWSLGSSTLVDDGQEI